MSPAGLPPVAGATWCPTVAKRAAETVVSNPGVALRVREGTVDAGPDGAVEAGSLVAGALLVVGWCCRRVEFPELVGAENMVSPVKV